MTDQATNQPDIDRDDAERAANANIADENTAYVPAAGRQTLAQDDQGIPQTGEEDPLAEVSTTEQDADAVADLSESDAGPNDDSIEPSRIPGSAQDIEVDGVTGPGPSG